MVNYACGFNQSKTGKYFEWIIKYNITQHNTTRHNPTQYNALYNMLSWEFKLAWGDNCSKNRKIRAKVDSRIHGRWRLQVMGSWNRPRKGKFLVSLDSTNPQKDTTNSKSLSRKPRSQVKSWYIERGLRVAVLPRPKYGLLFSRAWHWRQFFRNFSGLWLTVLLLTLFCFHNWVSQSGLLAGNAAFLNPTPHHSQTSLSFGLWTVCHLDLSSINFSFYSVFVVPRTSRSSPW